VCDLCQGGDGLRIQTLSALNLEKKIGSHGATWLDRELIARERMAIADSGFGRLVNNALSRRAQRLVEMSHATAKDGNIHISASTVATLQRQEVERVGRQMARERGPTYVPANAGDYVSGRLAGIANLVSGRFAMIENGLGFQLVPRQPILEKRIGQHITGLQRDDGGIEWTLGRNRGPEPVAPGSYNAHELRSSLTMLGPTKRMGHPCPPPSLANAVLRRATAALRGWLGGLHNQFCGARPAEPSYADAGVNGEPKSFSWSRPLTTKSKKNSFATASVRDYPNDRRRALSYAVALGRPH
jgi:hypothetical protein